MDAYCIYIGVVLTNSMQNPTILPKGKVGTVYLGDCKPGPREKMIKRSISSKLGP